MKSLKLKTRDFDEDETSPGKFRQDSGDVTDQAPPTVTSRTKPRPLPPGPMRRGARLLGQQRCDIQSAFTFKSDSLRTGRAALTSSHLHINICHHIFMYANCWLFHWLVSSTVSHFFFTILVIYSIFFTFILLTNLIFSFFSLLCN